MKKTVILIFLISTIDLLGQNFLANPGFEEINQCEEYGASCAPEAWFRIPPYDLTVTDKAAREPHGGKISELVVVENIYNPLSRRVFLYTKILCPLQKGKEYQLSFFFKNLRLKNLKIEALFSKEELIAGVKNPLNYKPDFIFTSKDLVKGSYENNWKKVEGKYVATGEEKFLTLGHFSKKEIKATRKEVSNFAGDVVILIDDIQLIPLDENEELCKDFEIEKAKLYEQNYRHTNKISVNGEPAELVRNRWEPNFFEKPLDEKHEEKEDPIKPVLPDRLWEGKDTLVFEIPFVAFDFDKAQINNEFKNRLDLFAKQIQYLNPEKIQFIGHTDSMGSHRYNKKLSVKRATSVKNYLYRYDFFKKVSSETIGKGESSPKATNKTVEGRQANRRVEIVVYKNKTDFSSK